MHGDKADTITDVTVVGGGDIGLITALAVDRMNPDIDVAVIDDFGREIPQVGKSTYREIQSILHGSLGIDEREFIASVRPVWKASVYFRDWCDRSSFHYPFDPQTKYPPADTPDAVEHYYHYYDELYASPDHPTTCEAIVQQGKSPWYFDGRGNLNRYDNVAYHLNTERFNDFLRNTCRDRGVALVDDEIVTVETTGSHIDGLHSETRTYEADLYVDATGFDRVLRGEQDPTFREFDLPLDTALNVRIERGIEEVIPATVVESGDYGWFWHIDTYDNRDLGYVFAADYVDHDDAVAEFLDHIETVAPEDAGPAPVDAEDIATYEFTSGYHERAWLDNCLAVGNAEGFVEPLQSTGLTANATAAVRFANLLSGRGRVGDDAARERYNAWVADLWESIADFISAHYAYSDGDTAFWDDVSSLELSERTERIRAAFDRHGFDWTVDPLVDAEGVRSPEVFDVPDFYTIMRSMGVTSELYESGAFEASQELKTECDRQARETAEEVADYLSHQELYTGVMEL